MTTGGWIFVAIIVALIAWVAAIYNGLVGLRNRFKNAFSQIGSWVRCRTARCRRCSNHSIPPPSRPELAPGAA